MIDSNLIRSEFPVKENVIYCNNAAVAPLPVSTAEMLAEFTSEYCRFGSLAYPEWMERVDAIRLDYADFLNADKDEIAFVKNTSTGLSFFAGGFDFQPGDEVIVFAHEFPSNIYPWLALEKKGVVVKTMAESDDYSFDYAKLESIITPRTRALSVSFIEFSTGFRHDLLRIGEICRKYNVIFVLDAIQGCGVFPIDVQKYHIDFLCADGHKWLCAPEGCGVLYCRSELIPKIQPLTFGWNTVVNHLDYDTIDLTPKNTAQRFEEGSPNLLGIFALGNSLRLIRKVGLDAISAHLLVLTDSLISGLDKSLYSIRSPRSDPYKSSILCVEPLKADANQLYQILFDKKIFVATRRGAIRISPHFYNDFDEMSKICSAMNLLGSEK